MERENYRKTLSLIAIVLLISSAVTILAMVSNTSAQPGVTAAPIPSGITTYPGGPNNESYAYPIGPGGDSGNTFSNSGPAPNTPNVKWEDTAASLGLSGSLSALPPIAFGGNLYSYIGPPLFGTGASILLSLNAQTGALNWQLPMPQSPRGFGTATFYEIDPTHIGWEGSGTAGFYIVNTQTGTLSGQIDYTASNETTTAPFSSFGGGSVMYWGGFYDSWDHVKITTALGDPTVSGVSFSTAVHLAVAIDCSNPNAPQVKWTWIAPTGIEALCSAPGIVYFGGYGEGQIFALNATTGALLWTSYAIGNTGYIANYYNGYLYQSASSITLKCWNATTGQVIFVHDQGPRAFFVFGDSLYDGMYLGKNIAVPYGIVGAWSATTGAQLWETPAQYTIAYLTPVCADGKMYVEQYSGTVTSSATNYPATFSCFDVFTGDVIWQLPGVTWNFPIVAYGNLYGQDGSGNLYCISDTESQSGVQPAAFPEFHYSPNPTTEAGVLNGVPGPNTLTSLWQFQANGPITGSACAANGMVYFGSINDTIYALNSDTGALIWNYTTNLPLAAGRAYSSTPAYANGIIYTGADDGSVHALNANTGAVIWTQQVGGYYNAFWISAWQPRSSPQVDNGQVFVGALDGKLYCLNAQTGQIEWSSYAGSVQYPPGGTPLVTSNAIYIAGSNCYMYAFNRATGALLWTVPVENVITYPFALRSLISTPIYDRGCLWVSVATSYLDRINATTGQILSTIELPYSFGSGTMTPAITAPAILESPLYVQTPFGPIAVGTGYYLYVGDGFQYDCFDVTTFHYSSTIFVNGSATTGFFGPGAPGVYQTLANGTVIPESNSLFKSNTVQNNESLASPTANETSAPLVWTAWLGHQTYSSAIIDNDLQGIKLYVGDDVDSITVINATPIVGAGNTLSSYTTEGPNFATPCIYNDTMYYGAQGGIFYAFRNPEVTNDFTIYAAPSKTGTMWNNETLTIQGNLKPVTSENSLGFGSYTDNYLPNASVTVAIVDATTNAETLLNTTTNNEGFFSVSYQPTAVGTYNWLAEFPGSNLGDILYEPAYTEYTQINVTQAPASPTPAPVVTPSPTPVTTATPTPSVSASASASLAPSSSTSSSKGISATDIYVIVAVIIIIVIAVAAYLFTRRGKKPAA